MAIGIPLVVAANAHQEILVGSGNTQYLSVRVLNPNDGVAYVARNRDCSSISTGAWDWKIPSQSYAILGPGPWQTIGVFYLDQSGSGRQGEFVVYPSLTFVDEPFFVSIGRALASQVTSMDLTEGSQPPNPPIGICRLFADNAGNLWHIHSDGSVFELIDTATNLGGALTGHLPNPALASGVTITNPIINGAITGSPSFGIWTNWTPACTQGGLNPSLNVNYAAYNQIGKIAWVSCYVTFTSAGQTGFEIIISTTPVAPRMTGVIMTLGSFTYIRSGVTSYVGSVVATSQALLRFQSAASTGGANLGSSPNFAVAVNDALSFTLTYEAS